MPIALSHPRMPQGQVTPHGESSARNPPPGFVPGPHLGFRAWRSTTFIASLSHGSRATSYNTGSRVWDSISIVLAEPFSVTYRSIRRTPPPTSSEDHLPFEGL